MKFDFIIGNPPYQLSKKDTRDVPIYDAFMDSAYSIATKIELITPAKFLFNAAATPKGWSEKILADTHFKVLKYEPDSKKIFSNADIKGGVAIHYYDNTADFGAIESFHAIEELKGIKEKVLSYKGFIGLNTEMWSGSAYKISDSLSVDYPEEFAKLKPSARKFFASNVFDTLSSDIFHIECREDDICLLGRSKNERVYRYINKKYVIPPNNFSKYKVFIPEANGCGAIGETLSTPLIGAPLIGGTQTFISFGSFDEEYMAVNALKYILSKFCRCCLGLLKVTQHNPPEKWKYVPLQDFTSNSDIDWSKSIHEIDMQLYEKYGLTKEEIDFIETNVKEME